MNESNKISAEDIKKLQSLSNSEIEKKLKDLLDDSKNGAVKKMLSGVNVEKMRNKLKTSSKEELEGFLKIIGRIDPAIIGKIKKSLGAKE